MSYPPNQPPSQHGPFGPVNGQPPTQPKKSKNKRWIIGTLAGLAVLGIAVNAGGNSEDKPATVAQSTTTTAPTTTKPQLTDADREKYNRQAQERAEAARQAAAAAEAARLDPNTYEWVSERDFAMIAKDPSSAIGRKIVLFGRVYQFDAATGTDSFLAHTGPVQGGSKYDYDQNTWVDATDPKILAPVVEDDIVKMYVEVKGAYSYDTQIGGRTSVPKVAVNIIEVVG